jgi:hypothetical protein
VTAIEGENHLAPLQLASGLIAFRKAHTARLALSQEGEGPKPAFDLPDG